MGRSPQMRGAAWVPFLPVSSALSGQCGYRGQGPFLGRRRVEVGDGLLRVGDAGDNLLLSEAGVGVVVGVLALHFSCCR